VFLLSIGALLLGMMKVILIRVIIKGKKVINIVLESEMTQLF